jgi:hypothetical protein
MIRDIRSNTSVRGTPMEQLQGKIHRVRQHIRGWVKNTGGQYKKEKKNILNTLDVLDQKKAENVPLSANELDLKQYLNKTCIIVTGGRS